MSRQIVFVREKYPSEFRTMIVPNEVPYYTEKGFEVFVELGIGEKIGFAEPAGCPKAPACLVRRPTDLDPEQLIFIDESVLQRHGRSSV
ncbi:MULTISPECIES: hypothetical protein [Rhizobium]|jgi:alanine dehydrogenase|nr:MULTISPECIES: hypothetical protein [Rhizobium]MBB4546105.1 alanine dehydrogenase [Rhizobium leguminosarum]MBB5683803.1 alanine dehydrogenase [Rhizobium leguminosarum]MBP2484675.1 alanine dehydrogenase [Rhizobium leguminosarum]ULR42225.1 hypothetical protein MHI61_01245 [Rhizobium sp. K102]